MVGQRKHGHFYLTRLLKRETVFSAHLYCIPANNPCSFTEKQRFPSVLAVVRKKSKMPQNSRLGYQLSGDWRENITKLFSCSFIVPCVLSPPLLSATTKGVPGTQDSPVLGAITGLAQPLCFFLMAIPPLGLAAAGKLSAYFSVVLLSCPSHWTCWGLPWSPARWEFL